MLCSEILQKFSNQFLMRSFLKNLKNSTSRDQQFYFPLISLKSNTLCVKLVIDLSYKITIDQGVPQGTLLGSIFLLYDVNKLS